MASGKNPTHLLLPIVSDDDGIKPSKNAASSEWPLKTVAVLLDIYLKKLTAGRGCLRGNDWEEVMSRVNSECQPCKTSKTVKQCRDKVDSLKRRYKIEKRKAVNGIEVSWPFFSKLDEMMGLVFKQAKGFDCYDMPSKSTLYYSHRDNEEDEGDDDDSKQDFSSSPREYLAAGSKRYSSHLFVDFLENGKARAVGRDSLAKDSFNRKHPHPTPRKFFTHSRPGASTDNSSQEDSTFRPPQPGIPIKSHPRRRKEADNPIQDLADAITGFAEVYARVELAKLEIMTTMKLEPAKRRRKIRRKKDEENPSSSSSGQRKVNGYA